MQLVPSELSIDDKIKNLLLKYNITEPIIIDREEDKPMILMALSQTDIVSVKIDEENGLVIEYEGSEWENNE